MKKKTKQKTRKTSDLERSKGRSGWYWQMDPREQWEEDKRNGLLDWDGK
jgi:hypothetical protein